MENFLAGLLLANAVFNAVVWPRFGARVARDARARDDQGRATHFLIVHRVLVVVALLLAVASAVAGVTVLIGWR